MGAHDINVENRKRIKSPRKRLFKIDNNPRYRPGALWKTRTRIKAQCEYRSATKHVFVPRGEVIMLLGYIIRPTHEEHIQFLWNEQVLYALDLDVGLQFWIDPGGVNSSELTHPQHS